MSPLTECALRRPLCQSELAEVRSRKTPFESRCFVFYLKDNNNRLKFRKMLKFAIIITDAMGYNDMTEH